MTHDTPGPPEDQHDSHRDNHRDNHRDDKHDDGQHKGRQESGRPLRLGRCPLPRSGADGADGAGGPPSAAAPPRWLRGSVAPGVPVEVQHARQLAARVGADRVLVALTLERRDGGGERAPLRGSDDVLVTVEEMVETVGQGPSTQVLQTARPCAVDDLHAATDRWPMLLSTFVPPRQARSVLVVPLLVHDTPSGTATDDTDGVNDASSQPAVEAVAVVGLLVLSRDEPRPFTAPQITAATTGAELVTLVLLSRLADPGADGDQQNPSTTEATGVTGTTSTTDDLDPATLIDSLLTPRAHLVPQAVGLITGQNDVDAVEARRRLHTEAFTTGQTVHQIAEHLLGDQH